MQNSQSPVFSHIPTIGRSAVLIFSLRRVLVEWSGEVIQIEGRFDLKEKGWRKNDPLTLFCWVCIAPSSSSLRETLPQNGEYFKHHGAPFCLAAMSTRYKKRTLFVSFFIDY